MSNQSDTVKLLLLGSVQAYVGTRQVALRGRAARIALARLALAGGRPVPVSALIDDLWQEKHPRDAVHALQAHMHRLRALLPLHIEFVNDGYRIVGGAAELDAKLFGELSERGRSHLAAARPEQAASDLEQALGLWRGPALGEIDDVPGLRPFAVQLTEMQKAAITDHGEALLQCGRGESLITGLRASLALDPLQETAWHQLMRALWHTGRESEALNAYANARESFLDVLGAEPGTRLAELHAAMLSGAPDETPPAVRAASAGPASAPIADGPVLDGPVLDGPGLVGRREELASMELALRRSREGTQFVTVSGEPGIGKTRLAEELRRRATASGAIVLNGGCDPSVPVAHLPFAQMLRDYVHSDQDDDPELRRRAPELANVLPMLSGRLGDDPVPPADGAREVDPYSTMDAITAWLAHLAARRPLVLIIDDLQWADPQTLLTLRHLLHSPRRVKALVVLCLRDIRLPVDEDSPVSEFLRQSDRVTHIPLTRFTDDETAELTAAERELFPTAAVPHWLDEYVLSAAGGNPLFIVELTRQLLIGEVDDAGGIPLSPRGSQRSSRAGSNTCRRRRSPSFSTPP
ncbi:hypothetical protein GCM10025863_12940 [Microbacterium suwonense]|uniref:Uncharacterized protein n=1 Tax=Microbacterium suwonense TaxID=683047 RepID=A0ABM8FSN2_9MICO|nr:hypothetical protein GCM10025863_12940 [Microbacterium suwonense]